MQSEISGIPAPDRGGGFEAMKILHHFGITGEKNSMLKNKNIDEEIKNATGVYLKALNLIKENYYIN